MKNMENPNDMESVARQFNMTYMLTILISRFAQIKLSCIQETFCPFTNLGKGR
jgi:hypothetical protein